MEKLLFRLFFGVSVLSLPGDTAQGLVSGREYRILGLRTCFERGAAEQLAEFARDHQGSSTLFYLLRGARQCGDWQGKIKVTRHVKSYFDLRTGRWFYVFEFNGMNQGLSGAFYGVTTYNVY